jgi:hypothetical protein
VLVLSRARARQGVAASHRPRLGFSARGARPSTSALVPRLEHASSTRGRQVPAVPTRQTTHAPPAQAACMSCPCRSTMRPLSPTPEHTFSSPRLPYIFPGHQTNFADGHLAGTEAEAAMDAGRRRALPPALPPTLPIVGMEP